MSQSVFYQSPSDDLSRPGRMWIPARDRFVIWGDVSTCYHEGVPGHHLQCGTAVLNRDLLSDFQRSAFIAGHGEGWALYAERLMGELGLYEDPAFELGYLYAQLFRAARVVIDIGLHCGMPLPEPWASSYGPAWTPQSAYAFLHDRTTNDPAYDRAEVLRYLGWPAQAISYKLGEFAWLDLREDAKRRARAFDLSAWHQIALSLGSVGLDRLTVELTVRNAGEAVSQTPDQPPG